MWFYGCKLYKIPVQMIFSTFIMRNHRKLLTREMLSYLRIMNDHEVYCACHSDRLCDLKEIFEMNDINIRHEGYFNTYIFYGCESLKSDMKENPDLCKKIFSQYESKDEKEELLKLRDLPEGKCAILIPD